MPLLASVLQQEHNEVKEGRLDQIIFPLQTYPSHIMLCSEGNDVSQKVYKRCRESFKQP